MGVPHALLPNLAKPLACAVPLYGYGEPDEPVIKGSYTAVERTRDGEERPILGITGS
jgi:hypothetical protein